MEPVAQLSQDVPATAASLPEAMLSAVTSLVTLGGPVVAILLAMSVFAAAIVIVKLWQFASLGRGDRARTEASVARWRAGDGRAAIARLDAGGGPLSRVVGTAMAGLLEGRPEAHVREQTEQLAAEELAGLRTYLRGLQAVAQAAPLLGLFGTVIGMIDAFRVLEASGGDVNPAGLAGGIWVALLTTAVGLVVAIPCSLVLAWFDGRVALVRRHMERLATEVLTHPPVPARVVQPHPVAAPRRPHVADAVHAH